MLRIASAAVLLALVITTIWVLPPAATLLLAAAAAAAAAVELAHITAAIGVSIRTAFLSASSALLVVTFVVAGTTVDQSDVLAAVLLGLVVTGGALTLASGPPAPAAITRGAVTLMAPCYLGLPLGAIAWVQWTTGPAATSWLLSIIAVSDTAQYYTGRAFGRRKLSPAVSPAKTVEGAVGGVLIAGIVGPLLGSIWLPHVDAAICAMLAVVLALAGIVGDLFESLLKRSAGVKDSSTLIPGHGGVLDRVDSHLFAAPIYYLFLRYVA